VVGKHGAAAAGDYRNGQKGAIVELFGWPYGDIAQECTKLAAYGYLGFKVTHRVELRKGRCLHARKTPLPALPPQMWSPVETMMSVNTIQNLLKCVVSVKRGDYAITPRAPPPLPCSPWWGLYQPMSYRFQGRFGNSTLLHSTLQACRALGVRSYAEAGSLRCRWLLQIPCRSTHACPAPAYSQQPHGRWRQRPRRDAQVRRSGG
jgi:alpha-amylase